MKKIVGLLLAFIILLGGSAFFIYRYVQAEGDDLAVEITEKAKKLQGNENKSDVMTSETTAQGSGQNLKTVLNVPDIYEVDLTDAKGNASIKGAVEVQIPDVTAIPTLMVGEKEFSQEWLDRVNDTFFPQGRFYIVKDQEAFERAKPLEEENEQFLEEENEQFLEEENEQLIEVDLVLKTMGKSNEEIKEKYAVSCDTSGNSFQGIVRMPDGNLFQYFFDRSLGHMYMHIQRFNKEERQEADKTVKDEYYGRYWVYAITEEEKEKSERPETPTMYPVLSEQKLREMAVITPEKAKAIADPYVEKLGVSGLECEDWDYQAEFVSDMESTGKAGYLLHYVRHMNNVPVTYTSEEGTGWEMSNVAEETKPGGYELVDILVTEQGIEAVKIGNMYEKGEILEESPALLDFAQIQDIFEKNYFEKSVYDHEDIDIEDRDFHLTDVKLGYMRIYNPNHPTVGQMIPVWDFIGWEECIGCFGKDSDSGPFRQAYNIDGAHISFMTINAIDGSIISRLLGY